MRWTDAANIRVTRTLVQQELEHLDPRVEREAGTATAAIIDIDVPDEHSSTDNEAARYALWVLTQVLGHDDAAEVIGVALDSTTEPETPPVVEVDAAPAPPDDLDVLDVEEVDLNEDTSRADPT